MTVAQVVALGNKVEIIHFRRVARFAGYKKDEKCTRMYKDLIPKEDMYTRQEIINGWGYAAAPHNKGGKTVVTVTTPTGQVLHGTAICANRDNFNKKLGVQIALGRAMTSGK